MAMNEPTRLALEVVAHVPRRERGSTQNIFKSNVFNLSAAAFGNGQWAEYRPSFEEMVETAARVARDAANDPTFVPTIN
jgi:hypothetical protein